jgi:acyl-CoA reductase-like NAD-dependent aldehyde dehydrogenase
MAGERICLTNASACATLVWLCGCVAIVRSGELQSGNTWLNAHLVDVMAPHAPFGGIRTSGTGKEGGGKIGIKEFVDQKTVRIAKKPASS